MFSTKGHRLAKKREKIKDGKNVGYKRHEKLGQEGWRAGIGERESEQER